MEVNQNPLYNLGNVDIFFIDIKVASLNKIFNRN